MLNFSRRSTRKNPQVFGNGHGENSAFFGAHQKIPKVCLDGPGENSESPFGCSGEKYESVFGLSGKNPKVVGDVWGKNPKVFLDAGKQKRRACCGLANTKSSSISITFLVGLMVQASPSCPFLLRPTCVDVEEQLSKECCCIASR